MEHPDLAVRMTTSNEICDLRAGDADVAIRAGGGGWEGLDHHRLFESSFTPMASPGCIAEAERKLGRKLEPDDMPHQNLIGPGDDWWQQWFSDNGVPADVQALRRAGIRLDNQANEGHAAMAGQGFALLTPLLWRGDVAAGRLLEPHEHQQSQGGIKPFPQHGDEAFGRRVVRSRTLRVSKEPIRSKAALLHGPHSSGWTGR